MLNCTCCGSTAITKGGKTKNKQRYKCKNCDHYFIPNANKKLSFTEQLDLVEWYLEGNGIRGLARRLRISHSTVIYTLRLMAEKLRPMLPLKAEYIEFDELFFFIGKKKNKK